MDKLEIANMMRLSIKMRDREDQKMLLEKLCHLIEIEYALKIVYPEKRSWIQKLRDR